MSNIQRRRDDAVNVVPPRPVPGYRVVQEVDQLSRADQRLDRYRESGHQLALRDLRREFEERQAEVVVQASLAVELLKARRRFNYEAKQELLRARKESQILAGDDLELTAKFSLLDDDMFQAARLLGLDLDD